MYLRSEWTPWSLGEFGWSFSDETAVSVEPPSPSIIVASRFDGMRIKSEGNTITKLGADSKANISAKALAKTSFPKRQKSDNFQFGRNHIYELFIDRLIVALKFISLVTFD